MTDQKQSGNVEYFNCPGSMITNDARCTGEITSSYAMTKAVYSKNKILFTSKVDFKFKISCTDCVRDEKALQPVLESRNILQRIKRNEAKCIGHILLRNCLLKHITEGKIEGKI